MLDLPFPWCVYNEIQSKALCCDRITDRSWGIENSLNKFLTAVDAGSVITDPQECAESVGRAMATGSRRNDVTSACAASTFGRSQNSMRNGACWPDYVSPRSVAPSASRSGSFLSPRQWESRVAK